MLRRISSALLLLALSANVLAVPTSAPQESTRRLTQQEHHIARPLQRAAQFIDVPHLTSAPACADVRPPQALATPDPFFNPQGGKVRVSFIVGTDGRVHSPLILESAGLAGDRRVLQTVRSWRYRPATCNGVPTETEGKVEFFTR